MDIEKLTKSQIVLLTLLISFVTSIATGIVTVSLMDQAPPVVAQTVNRVIEHTIETVASTSTRGQAAASVITQEKTVVVRESDLISQAVARAQPSLVRLYTIDTDNAAFLGLGIVIDADGAIITDTAALGDSAEAVAELPDGSRVRAFVNSRDTTLSLAYLASATSTIDGKKPIWNPIAVSTGQPLLGQTVIMVAGKTVTRISDGIITSIVPGADENASPVIETNVSPESIAAGSPLLDTDGSLIGISTGSARSLSQSGFLEASALMKSVPKS